MNDSVSLQTLEEMKRYYQASASEYDTIFHRQGRYDQGPELNARWFAEWDEVFAQLHAFLRSCWAWLRPGGKMFFVDDTGGPTAAPDQPVRQDRQIETRTLNDGRSFQIVKNFYEAADLVASCVRAGFDITVRQTTTSFLYGFGTRLPSERDSENLSHG